LGLAGISPEKESQRRAAFESMQLN
jgi:hypothetical protein